MSHDASIAGLGGWNACTYAGQTRRWGMVSRTETSERSSRVTGQGNCNVIGELVVNRYSFVMPRVAVVVRPQLLAHAKAGQEETRRISRLHLADESTALAGDARYSSHRTQDLEAHALPRRHFVWYHKPAGHLNASSPIRDQEHHPIPARQAVSQRHTIPFSPSSSVP